MTIAANSSYRKTCCFNPLVILLLVSGFFWIAFIGFLLYADWDTERAKMRWYEANEPTLSAIERIEPAGPVEGRRRLSPMLKLSQDPVHRGNFMTWSSLLLAAQERDAQYRLKIWIQALSELEGYDLVAWTELSAPHILGWPVLASMERLMENGVRFPSYDGLPKLFTGLSGAFKRGFFECAHQLDSRMQEQKQWETFGPGGHAWNLAGEYIWGKTRGSLFFPEHLDFCHDMNRIAKHELTELQSYAGSRETNPDESGENAL